LRKSIHQNLFNTLLSALFLFFDDVFFDQILQASFMMEGHFDLNFVHFIDHMNHLSLQSNFETNAPSLEEEGFISLPKSEFKKIIHSLKLLLLNDFVQMGDEIILDTRNLFQTEFFVHAKNAEINHLISSKSSQKNKADSFREKQLQSR